MAAAGQKLPVCLLCLGGLKLAGWQKLPEGEERRCWQAEEQGGAGEKTLHGFAFYSRGSGTAAGMA